MKNPILSIMACGVALLAPLSLQAKIVRTIEKVFPAQSIGSLQVQTEGGHVTVQSADISEVRVMVRESIRACDDKVADQLLEKLDLRLTQKGEVITLAAKFDPQLGGSWFNGTLPITVDFVVTVPRQFNLKVKTAGGDIKLDAVQGNVEASTDGGNVVAQLPVAAGARIDARTAAGRVSVNDLPALQVEKGGSGKSSLVGRLLDGGAQIKLRTVQGDIRLGHS